MDYNIKFKAIGKNIYVSKDEHNKVDEKKLNNTNVISTDDIIFSLSYIRKNFDIVVNFLNLIILKFDIKTVIVEDSTIDLIYMDVLKRFKNIEKIMFIDDVQINSQIFIYLYEFENIKKIECYEMPAYLIERLDENKNIKVLTRHKISKKNIFLTDNHLNTYTDFYYKKMLIIDSEMTKEIINDIDNFLTINNNLKLIRIIKYSNEAVTAILDLLKKHNKKNILISINEKNNNLNEIITIINYIKKHDKKFIETNKIKFKLNYSNEYKFKNFFKELNIKLVCTILLIILILVAVFEAVNLFKQYEDEQSVKSQMSDINNLINSFTESTIDDNETDINYLSNEDFTEVKNKSTYSSPYYVNYTQALDQLVKINSDTVGWLTVNNTKINYPVVQNKNSNDYYLNHDFRYNKNTMGWIFMDYRNDPTNLDANTIIYGHNIITGIMFGTLKNTLSSSWYKNSDNQVITFNTRSSNMKWQIFSIYRLNSTEDYLKTSFDTTEDHQAFIDLIKGRSVYNFNVDVTPSDKILTLQSCVGSHNQRVVVHAKLLTE